MTLRLLIPLSLLLLCSACSLFRQSDLHPGAPGLQVVAGVPFRAQQVRDDCGPAALASLFAHRGRDIPLADITRAVYSPALGGSLLPDMENYARSLGFATRSGRGDLDLLRHLVAAGRPVVIPVATGPWVVSRPHFVVVYGYDEGGFLAHAGIKPAAYMAAGDLLRRWEKMNRLYLALE